MKTKRNNKVANGLSSKEIEDLKQSEGLNAWKIAHYAHIWNSKVDAQAALAVSKLNRKRNKVRTLNFKTFF
jgi:hypothetical protein